MSGKPRLLDLCCGAGGASVGYARAGFEVVGVDRDPQPEYPFPFIQADVLSVPLAGFDVYHASPPCQAFSRASHFHHAQARHANLIPAVRARLLATGKPYVMENVPGAPLRKRLMLCGVMFGLDVVRHRYFESNLPVVQPPHPRHVKRASTPGSIPAPDEYWCVGGHFGHKAEAARAMGIDWITDRDALAQAIPPRYTEYLGWWVLARPVHLDLWSSEQEVGA